MNVSEKILEKEFESVTTKNAYLDCCKWISTNIIAVNNSENITYKIEKVETKDWNKKIRLTVYVFVDEEEVRSRHCEICKEVTGSFFMMQNKNMCESCKMQPYRKRLTDRLKLLREGLKGKVIL